MYRSVNFQYVVILAMGLAVASGGCGSQSASTPSASEIENFQQNNPGVLKPVSDGEGDNG